MNAKRLEKAIAELERYPLAIFAAVLTYLTPIPSAYLVGTAVIDILEWNPIIGWIAAISVELVGIVSVNNSLNLWRWNRTHTRKKDEHAPVLLANIAVGFYLVIVITMTVLLDSFPHLAKYAPIIFPLLAIVSAVGFVIRLEQNEREDALADEAVEMSMKKREAVLNRAEARMKAREDGLKGRETAVNDREAMFDEREGVITARESAVKNAEPLLAEIEARETAVKVLETAMKKLNPLTQDVVYMIAGSEDTGAAIAERYGKSAGYVSGLRSKMNGRG